MENKQEGIVGDMSGNACEGLLDCSGLYYHHSHIEYEVDGVTYMRMKFHVSGSKRKGEAFVDLKKVRLLYLGLCNKSPLSLPFSPLLSPSLPLLSIIFFTE